MGTTIMVLTKDSTQDITIIMEVITTTEGTITIMEDIMEDTTEVITEVITIITETIVILYPYLTIHNTFCTFILKK